MAQLDRLRVVRGRFEAPDGSTFERDVVRNQEVVAIVPVLADDVSLTRTFWLIVHAELRDVARVRATADFVVEQTKAVRALFMDAATA